MAKKFVRGITDIKTINNQDLDTNNVNDLLSDGKHNYIHRKKSDGTEEYHNLTNNIKTIEAEDNGLLTVINYNNSTNKAKLTVHHDPQKEQKIYSTDDTIEIVHGDNGTGELTNVDVNAEKVMLNDNLLTDNGISKSFTDNQTTLTLQPEFKTYPFDLNTVFKGKIVGQNLAHSPGSGWFVYQNEYMFINNKDYIIQTATRYKLSGVANNEVYMRTLDGTWSEWSKQVTDESEIDTQLAQKQNTLTNNTSIAVLSDNSLIQLYNTKRKYTNDDGEINTWYQSIADVSSATTAKSEFNFTIKINKDSAQFQTTLQQSEVTSFSRLITKYGSNNTVNISGCVITLSSNTLTVTTTNNTNENYVMSFSDILD